MKKAIVSGLVAVLLAGCDGEGGPTGPPGEDSIAQVFEADVSYDYDSDGFWLVGIEIPSRIEVFESDVVLAYRLVNFVDDEDARVWEMLPNVYFLNEDDIIQYVFNHTFFDVELVIDGNFDLRDLDPGFTDDQLFRFVVAPAALVTENNVDVTDYGAVVKALGIVSDHRL